MSKPSAHSDRIEERAGERQLSSLSASMPRPPRVTVGAIPAGVEGGRFPAKRCVGDIVTVTAEIVADGHDVSPGCCAFAPVVRITGASGRWSVSTRASISGPLIRG